MKEQEGLQVEGLLDCSGDSTKAALERTPRRCHILGESRQRWLVKSLQKINPKPADQPRNVITLYTSLGLLVQKS